MRRQRGGLNRATGVRTHPERLRLFRRNWLERLTVMPPRLFVVVWAVLIPVIGWTGRGAVGVFTWFGLIAAGLLAWSLFEYTMHRFVFHPEPQSALGRRMAFVMHGNHHDDPDDPGRSMMPLAVSLPWSGAIWAGCAIAFGRTGSVFFLGFAIGYVVYDSVHYACHQLPVKGRLLRALRRHHLRHHFGREEGSYAITAIFWDRIFGTHVSARGASGARMRQAAK